MKIVINTRGGWFELSERARSQLETDELSVAYESDYSLRTDPRLVRVVEELGTKEASGMISRLEVVDVPDGTEWGIITQDGIEIVVDRNRVWGIPKNQIHPIKEK